MTKFEHGVRSPGPMRVCVFVGGSFRVGSEVNRFEQVVVTWEPLSSHEQTDWQEISALPQLPWQAVIEKAYNHPTTRPINGCMVVTDKQLPRLPPNLLGVKFIYCLMKLTYIFHRSREGAYPEDHNLDT